MALPVSLRAVAEELDMIGDDDGLYINPKTGELVVVTEYDREISSPAVEAEESEDFISLPSRFDIDNYNIMRSFCESVQDPTLREDLLSAIRGSGAFRRFKDMIYRADMENAWYRFKAEALEQIAADFLDEHGIAYVRDTAE